MEKGGKFRICPIGQIAMGFLLILGVVLMCPGREEAAQKKGSILVKLYSDEKKAAASDGVLTLYQVALSSFDDGDMICSFTPAFEDCGVSLKNISDPAVAASLEKWVKKQGAAGTDAAIDAAGDACFPDLIPGLYLICQTGLSTGFFAIDAFLVSVPYRVGEQWVYDVDAAPKTEISPEPAFETSAEPETETAGNTLPQTGPVGWPLFLLTCTGTMLFAGGIRVYQR